MSDLIESELPAMSLMTPFSTFTIKVLLIDDQIIIAQKVKSMLSEEADIAFEYCQNPTQALEVATRINPTVILQDLVMPGIDGLDLTRYFRANSKTRDIPLLVLSNTEDPEVKAEAFARGADDYIVKLPNKIELIARIRYHSNAYIRLLQRNEAYKKLQESQQILHQELAEAAGYVRSLLPEPQTGLETTIWQFIPSAQLGGDAFGYYQLDDQHCVFYLLDVCGHGVGAALLSISIMNALRAQALPNADFYNPVSVLQVLNSTFTMEQHQDMFFTLWYGVYNRQTRQLIYSSAGHPPALLIKKKSENSVEYCLLKTEGIVIGAFNDVSFVNATVEISHGSQLFIFSDGTYEVVKHDGTMLSLEEWLQFLQIASKHGSNAIEKVYEMICAIRADTHLVDDYSILHVTFN
jgi:sigma-B regulation protein RsbU (phosphoserine phosphatase)